MPERILGGRYKVQGKIGIGGMATVYRGTDEVLTVCHNACFLNCGVKIRR